MLILTPNRRLAAFSLQQHIKNAIDNKQKVWSTPHIYPLETWLHELWLRCSGYKPVLSINQQQLLMEQIIQSTEHGAELLRISPTANSVIDAWTYLVKWQIPISKVQAYADYSEDTAAFCQWITEYNAWLLQHDWVDSQSVVKHLLEYVESITTTMPSKICLRGVQDLPPLYQQLFKAFAANGIEIVEDNLLANAREISRTEFTATEDEVTAAAIWAAKQSGDNIGIIVPNLELQRQKILNIFLDHIPEDQLNISAPLKLADYNLIDTALLVLRQAKPTLNYEDISILLRSPYINAGVYSMDARARLDRIYRDNVTAKITTNKVVNKQLHSAQYWAEMMQTLLQNWGWPGSNQLSVIDADLTTCWTELLDEYRKLDIIISKHTYAEALQYITRLANATPFLPAEVGTTRVHVLGMLEAEGIPFDKLWVIGMTRESWPMEAKPNPFIPLEIQRTYNLPRSSARRELQVAKRLTANMRKGGVDEVIFSYPRRDEDSTCAPSNLIVDIPEVVITVPSKTVAINNLEEYSDFVAPKVEVTYVKGGTKILKLQAQCPFKAFAEIRLQADALSVPEYYLTPAQRGIMVHAILENYYKQQCQADMSDIIEQELQSWQHKIPQVLSKNYMELERTRLTNLLNRWLAYEHKRDRFTVQQLEQRHRVKIGGLSVNIQVDRVDKLADGTELVIDYKTGNIQPCDPQLAIYSQYVAKNAAVYYVKADNVRLQEYVAQEELDLAALANNFIDGIADVRPATAQICSSCHLQALCRIYDN